MTPILLRFLNFPVVLLVAAVGFGLQTALFSHPPLDLFRPDLLALLVIWAAHHRTFIEGGLLTLVLSHLAEGQSASPQGLFLLTYMSLFMALRIANRVFLIRPKESLTTVCIVASLWVEAAKSGTLALFNVEQNDLRFWLLSFILPALVNPIYGWVVFRWLERLDAVTYKDPRSALAEEERLGIWEEGL